MKINPTYLLLYFLVVLKIFATPKLTIITSVYDGDKYIRHFLDEVTKQTLYRESEHILINAASPGNEEDIILEYAERFPNIIYVKLEEDPGLYGVWNIGLQIASAPLITNANLDDTFEYQAHELLVNEFNENPEIDLVYSGAYITSIPCQKFTNAIYDTVYSPPVFDKERIFSQCFIGSHPVWKIELHQKIGLFDETFKCAGDWEFWMRAAKAGANFKRVNRITGLNYNGPETLSNKQSLIHKRELEFTELQRRYKT